MGSVQLPSTGALTPPATPTITRHRGQSFPSSPPQAITSLAQHDQSPSLGVPKEFPVGTQDYDMDIAKPLGTGLWSNVFLAIPSSPSTTASDLTPPVTPVKSEHSRFESSTTAPPRAYAIKMPAGRSAKAVLLAEAKALSQLSSIPNSQDHVVPFYGYDPRNGALVLEALPQSLEDYVLQQLNPLDAATRSSSLTALFPSWAFSLAKSLAWLHDTTNFVHADIKPGNILLKPTSSLPCSDAITSSHNDFKPLYADFSASFHLTAPPEKPTAGATWDFMAPEQLSSNRELSAPTPASDVYALAVTLLFVIIGDSPFAAAGSNRILKRHMIAQGDAMGFAINNDNVARQRLEDLEGRLEGRCDVGRVLRMALKKSKEERPRAEQMADWLEVDLGDPPHAL
ncbi:serine/threonine protein kinase [Coniosporium apollinis CBS 100218]|uniref:NEK6-subfamily protein kinase n=1 Tax=Coniosporium apollinis (strain CBS 100218) TaxID=1168221 RepID=R7Z3M3_CONA1|nr:serine/threonine protein kinase [Coniosporium apollinis CBS 100218]EON68693.1 serine/threonine protein kinase [Coniosporium apollinis CBS 100218]